MKHKTLHILSGGAAQGLVRALQPAFEAAHGCQLQATFGAVGAMKEKLLGGAPCDVLILTEALIEELIESGRAVAGSARALGLVPTGLAVMAGAAAPDVRTEDDLKTMLAGASAVYFPDPAKATAGIHFMKVLTALGLAESLATRLRTFPNGAAAMGAMAQSGDAKAVGCTQVTEILIAPGVELVGLLPPPHGLSTVYTAGVCAQALEADLAAAFVETLAAAEAAAARKAAGFS